MLTSVIQVMHYGIILILLCSVICIFRFEGFIKAGICTVLSATAYYFGAGEVNRLFGLKDDFYNIDFQVGLLKIHIDYYCYRECLVRELVTHT